LFKKNRELERLLQNGDNKSSTYIGHKESKGDIYIGHRESRSDMALAEYLNTYPESKNMRIMFLRESDGVYQFGSKRVYIKVEKGNKVLVRVGGGYLGIEEFIRSYTQEEVDKISKKNVALKYQEKITVQSLASVLHEYEKERELSPPRYSRKERKGMDLPNSPWRIKTSPRKERNSVHVKRENALI
jgi:hypothetical protein